MNFLSSFEQVFVVRQFRQNLISFFKSFFIGHLNPITLLMDKPIFFGNLECPFGRCLSRSWSFCLRLLNIEHDLFRNNLFLDLRGGLLLLFLELFWRKLHCSFLYGCASNVLEFEHSLNHFLLHMFIRVIKNLNYSF